jgi:hypothetical protein
MARLTIAAQTLTHGLNPTYSSVVGADDAQFSYNAEAFLHIKNTTGSGIVLTIPTNGYTADDLVVPAKTITVPANDEVFTKAFNRDIYRQSDGYVYLNAPSNGLDIAVLIPA